MDKSVQRRATQMAIDAFGGVYGVCAYMAVDPEDVFNWLTASVEMPRDCFLKIIDVICDNLTDDQRHAVEAARGVGRSVVPIKPISRRA